MLFIDTHTHLYTEEFDNDRQETVRRAIEAGATGLLLPNIDGHSIQPMLDMCHAYPGLCFPMLGLHPTELPDEPHTLLDEMERLLDAPDAPYIAIGEIGIDLYWDQSRREEQKEVFQRQIEWAIHRQLPLSIHTRSAHRELVDALAPYQPKLHGGVFHCFGGSAEEARELLDTFPGFVLGIGGTVTFKKSQLPVILKTTVPLNRIVLETDAPYLAPTPHRGKRNEPSFLPLVAEKLAAIYETTPEEVGYITTQNAKKVFHLP